MTTQIGRQPQKVKTFFDSVEAAAVQTGSQRRVTAEAAREVLNNGSIQVPAAVQAVIERFNPDVHHQILDSVAKGAAIYRMQHGCDPDPSLMECAFHAAHAQGLKLSEIVQGAQLRFDDATNAHHDQISLQPAMAITAIMAQYAEAIPFAAYLPADVKSNEGRLAILSNVANSDFGDYVQGGSLDGVAGGLAYLDSERVVNLTTNGGAGPFAVTVTARTSGAVSGSNPAVPLLRGRSMLMVNGLPAGREAINYGSGSNTISGQVTIVATSYALTGTVNSDSGAVSVSASPALPAGVRLDIITFVDYEKAPQVTPRIGTRAEVFSVFARASRGIIQVTMDAMTQMQSELGLDPRGQALMSARAQYAQERHYRVLEKGLRASTGAGLVDTWNYDVATQIAQKDRSQIWLNLQPILGGLSQRMANITVDHGITHLYVTGELAAQIDGLPSTIWQSSGLTPRPGIYRKGRLFGMYEVYYTPRILTETGNGQTSQILCAGRGSQVARNPIVMAEAVPAVLIPLATGLDMVQGDGFYTRNTTELNPHLQSAQGFALINVTNIK